MAEAQCNCIALEQQFPRTQMESHFIFNTLSVMQNLIHNRENEKAATYLHQFAQLLPTSLEDSRENYVLVSEEINALINYISQQAMRFGNSFDYSLQLYKGYEEDKIKIPPMLPQPFVENTIQHGVRHVPYKAHIDITIEKKERVLYCRIRDNGKGLRRFPGYTHCARTAAGAWQRD